jgi:L-iditol 2-dehydrogenase
MLFAQTSDVERIEISGASICVGERSLLGSYSASVDLQNESAGLVFSGKLPVQLLISHRVPLDKIEFAFRLATHPAEFPDENPLKIIVRPQEWAGDDVPRARGSAWIEGQYDARGCTLR